MIAIPTRRILRSVIAIAALVGAPWLRPAQAQVSPGDIVVADFEAGTGNSGAVFLVDGANGQRTLLSDFGNPAQGPTSPAGPVGVAIRDVSSILAMDNNGWSGLGVLFSVDSTTGERTILSDFADPGQGPLGIEPVGVAFVNDFIAATDLDAGTAERGVLFRIDPVTGQRAIISDFADPGQGPVGLHPTGVTRGANGTILVIDPDGGTDERGVLFQIDPATGQRTMISDFGNPAQGTLGVNPGGVALGAGGVILACDTEAGSGAAGALFEVDPATGQRTVLSDFGDIGAGPGGVDPFWIALDATGEILVSDDNAGTTLPPADGSTGNGALFRVSPRNGTRVMLSDFGNVAQGPTGSEPNGVAIVPLTRPGVVLAVSPFSGTNGGGEVLAIDLATGARTVVSDFGNLDQGPFGFDPVDIAIGAGGDILVVDEDLNGNGALFRINPVDGSRTVLSLFADPTQGPTAGQPWGVTLLEPDGDILVVTSNGGTGGRGALMSVDPDTGMRTMVSDFGDAGEGPIGSQPASVRLGLPDEALVVDYDTLSPVGGTATGMLYSVDLATGARIALSDFGDVALGPTGRDPMDLAIESSGSVLVVDTGTGGANARLFRVDPATGGRAVLSDFANPAQGPLGETPRSVILEEPGTILVGDGSAGAGGGAGALFRIDPTSGTRTLLSDFGNPSQGPVGARPFGLALRPDSVVQTSGLFADGFESGDTDHWSMTVP
jgi:hypothetical protein